MAASEADDTVFPVALGESSGNDGKILFVDDNTVVDSTLDRELECLSAEFRHRLGLLPEEEQELSEIFKTKLGLSVIDRDRLLSLINDTEHTIRQYSLEKFAQKHFQLQKGGKNFEVKFINNQLSQPLLPKENPFDYQASLYIFAAISRYMKGDFCPTMRVCQKPYIPVMMKIYKVMECFGSTSPGSSLSTESPNFAKQEAKMSKSKKQTSIKKLLRTIGKSYSKKVSTGTRKNSSTRVDETSFNSLSGGGDLKMPETYEDLLNSVQWELELIQFIVVHGIIRKELRDEIFCQLCCQVKNNPSSEFVQRGLILHSLCASCFLPSSQLISHYVAFLHQLPGNPFLKRITHNLTRSNETGCRFHPSNSLEIQAEKSQTLIKLPVHLIDGRALHVSMDSSCTSQDICEGVSSQLDLQDTFGFSLYVSAYERVSSMGCGADHVMDAITECEHMTLDRGEPDLTQTSWILSFRKELFTPWFDPSLDPVATELIYKQIKSGISKGDFQIPKGTFETLLAQILYIEFGELDLDLVRRRIAAHVPKSVVQDQKVVDVIAKTVMDIAVKMSLDNKSLDREEVRCMFVLNAVQYLPMNFSALFEAFNYGGFPNLPQQEVVIALNSRGIDILAPDLNTKLAHFDFSSIYNAATNNSMDLSNLVIIFLAVDGSEYSLSSPNAEVAAKITNAFLNGLRKRSRWAVAIKSFVYKDFRKNQYDSEFELLMGDTVELLDEINNSTDESEELLYGVCERTGLRGAFPLDVVYIIPTARRPEQEFLDALKAVGEEIAQSAEVQPLKSRVIMSDADTIRRRPDSSA